MKDGIKSYRMGSPTKDHSLIKDYIPGPGTYDLPKSIGKDTPSLSFRGRPLNFSSPPRSKTPGPGEYNPSDALTKVN